MNTISAPRPTAAKKASRNSEVKTYVAIDTFDQRQVFCGDAAQWERWLAINRSILSEMKIAEDSRACRRVHVSLKLGIKHWKV